jgi:hypothetical protein
MNIVDDPTPITDGTLSVQVVKMAKGPDGAESVETLTMLTPAPLRFGGRGNGRLLKLVSSSQHAGHALRGFRKRSLNVLFPIHFHFRPCSDPGMRSMIHLRF